MGRLDIDDAKMDEKDRVLSHPISPQHIEGIIVRLKHIPYTNKGNPYNYKTEQSKHEDWYFGYVNAVAIVNKLYEK